MLGDVDSREHSCGNGHQATETANNQRADNRVGHSATQFADRLGRLSKEIPFTDAIPCDRTKNKMNPKGD
jgi:hypothetical protein